MIKQKMPLFILSLLVLLLGVTVLQGIIAFGTHKEKTVTLSYAEVNPLEGTISGAMALAFKEKVEELSNGTVLIDIQSGGVLGSDDQILDNMLGNGNIADISRVSAFALMQYGCEKAGLLGIPYTFEDEEHFWNFAESNLAQEFLLEPLEKGLPIRGLCYGEEGFRNFFFKSKVSGLEDLKKRKIRVSSDPIMTGMLHDLGAYPAAVAFPELYSALSTGVVDGAEQPTANYCSNAFQEVAPYLLLDGHTLGVMQMVMSEYRWKQLDDKQKGWLMEAARHAVSVCREKVAEIEKENFALLKKEGITIIDVPDKSLWAQACQPTIQKNIGKLQKTYQQILDMK